MNVFGETKRLTLCALRSEDAESLFAYRSSPEVARFQGWVPETLEDARAFAQRCSQASFDEPDTWYQLAIRERAGNELVGDLGVHFVGKEQVEIGFTIAPRHQRRGYAKEAVAMLLSVLFDELGKHRAFASTDPENTASVALLHSLGFRQEAHHVQNYPWRGGWADELVLALLRSEWTPRLQ